MIWNEASESLSLRFEHPIHNWEYHLSTVVYNWVGKLVHGDRATRSSTKCDIIPGPRVGFVREFS